ncbi:MAG: hypothetical protein ACFHU9_14155 [Fluviicola sp.]
MEGYKELLDQLNGLVNSMEQGELNLEQLNDLEKVTRTLHERSIILRYKAYEASAWGDTQEENDEPVVEVKQQEEVEPVVSESDEVVEKEIEEEEASHNEPEEEPAFDFAIFDEQEETPGTQSVDIEEETKAEAEPEEVEATSIEPETVEEVKTVIDPVSPPEPADEIKIESEEIPPVPKPEPASGGSFLDRFAQQDNSVAGRFSAGPLNSLIGAFGLNERLRFINDLFDGSSEKFSDAIKALDSQSDLDAARIKAASYAEENEWDPEEEVVAEFMNYLNRRYA